MTAYINPQQKVLWHIERLAELQRDGRTSVPVNVEIDLSNRCSLGCEWCHFAYTHTRGPLAGKQEGPDARIAGGDLMHFELAADILDQLAEAGVKSVTWTGGGEPTLHPYFDGIVCRAHDLGLEQGLYTHGGHIDAERAALLKRAATWVYVSLDCADRASYRQAKGVDRFENAVAGIRALVAAQGGATVGVGYLLHAGNTHHVPRMVALGRELGVDYVQFRPAIRYKADEPGVRDEDAAWVADAVRWLRAYADDPLVIADEQRFAMYANWQGHGYTTCRWVTMQTVITPNGKMWNCCNQREHAQALLGDLAHESFADVWARVGPVDVGPQCRVLCRGHLANRTLDALAREPAHANFV